MNSTASPRPFTPNELPADQLLVRAIAARCVAAARGNGTRPEQVAAEYWPKDLGTRRVIERASTLPASIGGAGWADTLAAKATGAFLGSLQTSAAARLIAASLQLNLPGYATVTLPRASTQGAPQWISEANPLPVAQAMIMAATLGPPKKLGLIEALTREEAESSPDDVEGIVGVVLRDAMARSLDLAVFSSTAAGAGPAGILFGLTPITPAVGAPGAFTALTDLRTLIDATITASGGSGDVAFACSPGRALAVKTYAPTLADRVFAGAAIPPGELICVDVQSFTSMFGSDPDLLVSKEVAIHYEDTTPLQIGTPPATVAAPTRSAFQSDVIVLRMILKCAWALRVSTAVSFAQGLAW